MGQILSGIGKGSVTAKGFGNLCEGKPKIHGEQPVKIDLFAFLLPRFVVAWGHF